MANIFRTGREYLDSVLDTHNVESAVFIRSGQQTGVTLNVSPLSIQRKNHSGDYSDEEYAVSDFGIRMDTNVTPGDVTFGEWLGSDPIVQGDVIVYQGGTFEVFAAGESLAWEWTSIYKTGVRIHTIYQGEA